MSTEFNVGREPAGPIDELFGRELLMNAPFHGATLARFRDRAFDRLADVTDRPKRLRSGEAERALQEIVGRAESLSQVLDRARKVAPTEATVLVTGETGTGKELLARVIHTWSRRAGGPFVSVNCAAIPQTLIASELFGHERGAFTGALQRRLGRFELAAGGTLFLDEVGELPTETQVLLLSVLQERKFERIGRTTSQSADVRVVAATNRDLRQATEEGRFRRDLFYRLAVFQKSLRPARRWGMAVGAVALLVTVGCGMAVHWVTPVEPTQRDATMLLDEVSTPSLYHRLRPTGVPDIPMPRHLRPCCDFGYDLRLRYTVLPIPGHITNLKTIEEVGRHQYDSAVVTFGSHGDIVDEERNGLVFTCRGGFIDTAHVRDYADWTIYLGSRILEQFPAGATIDLSNEGGERRVVLERVDPEHLHQHNPLAVTMAMAQWLAVQLSIWHEIATWYGWSSFPGFPERASAFSPEDLYSNVLGTKIAAATAFAGGARSETLYERGSDAWLRTVVDVLGPVSKETTFEAMRSLDGTWWQSARRLPDPSVLLRRDISNGETFTPWLLLRALASEALGAKLMRECGGWPSPISLTSPSTIRGMPIQTLARLEIRVNPAIASQPPFDALGPFVTQDDFPVILAAIREQNRREFGARADRPD